MATSRIFNDMLNEYLAIDLLKGEMLKRDYFLEKVEKDDGWKGGTLPVPFKGAQASSLQFGGLTDSSDVAEYDYVRGQITTQPEVWATLKFNQRDLFEHDGKVSEKSFLKVLPDQLTEMMDYFKMMVAVHLLKGPHLAVVVSNGTAGGVLGVDKIDLFEIGQKITLIDGNTAQADYYVIAINVNNSTTGYPSSGEITVSATRGGAAADVSAFTVAQVAKIYHPGVLVAGTPTNNMNSLSNALLSAANGGSASLYGVTKTAFPYTQAVNVSGATITASNILDKLFDAYSQVRSKARGNANTFLMSYKHLGSVMKAIETQKGSFKTSATTSKASLYGWTEITITSVKGELTLVGIQEMPDDLIYMLDWSSMKFFSNGMFKKRANPDSGQQFYEVRATSGYYYLVDICLFGDLVVHKPANNGIIHSIANY